MGRRPSEREMAQVRGIFQRGPSITDADLLARDLRDEAARERRRAIPSTSTQCERCANCGEWAAPMLYAGAWWGCDKCRAHWRAKPLRTLPRPGEMES